MKIWIVQLNGKILVEYHRALRRPEHQQTEIQDCVLQTNSNVTEFQSKSNSKIQDSKDQQIDDLRMEIISHVIQNSRKLSLQLYQNQLNYTTFKELCLYFRAKHNVLFIFSQQQHSFTVSAVDNILFSVIRAYQQKCLNINNSYKLPIKLSNYQLCELRNLKNKIKQIIDEENYFQLVRLQSIKRSNSLTEVNLFSQMNKRINEMATIDKKQLEIRTQHVRFLHQTERNVSKYKIKCIFLCLFVVIIAVGLLITFNNYDHGQL